MIREVVLRRFKRFDEVRFDLSGHVILAGPNNCGKTTVLQAIAAWSLALKRWKELNDFQRHGGGYSWKELARLAFSAVPLRSFEFLWKDRDYTGLVEIEVLLDDGTKLGMEFKADSTEQIYVRPKREHEPEQVRKVDLEVVYVAAVGGLSNREFRLEPDAIETLLGEQKPGDVIRNLLDQASRGGSWDLLKETVQRLFGVELLPPQTQGGQIVCEYKQKPDGPNFDLSSAGSGFQQVLLLLACLYTRAGAVVLVDEPDAHLHVFLQDAIFYELQQASARTNSQLMLATHAEAIFNSSAPEQICLMVSGSPRRLSSASEVQQLREAVAVLQQSDLVAAMSTPGVLYLEGYTDLNLLRTWARVLDHPLAEYLNRTPFWHPKQSSARPDAAETKPDDHYKALRLVNDRISGVWLVDADGRQVVQPTLDPAPGRLNRVCWSRYEAESYLVHPAVLARFIDKLSGSGGAETVGRFFTEAFEKEAGAGMGAQIAENFERAPLQPPQLVERYLQNTKARSGIVGAILQAGGIHRLDYTRYHEIAACMDPSEIHPEVKEKLDFIQKAFGL